MGVNSNVAAVWSVAVLYADMMKPLLQSVVPVGVDSAMVGFVSMVC